MKNSTLILFSFLGFSFTTLLFSCKKDTVEETFTNSITQVKGSIDLKAGSETYTELFSSVVYSTSDTMVTFWGINLDTEDSFITTFGTVPGIGQTKQVSQVDDNGILFFINGSFQKGGFYSGESGTIKRVTTDKYEINVNLSNSQDPGNLLNISGTVIVGENN